VSRITCRYGEKYFLREAWKAGETAHISFIGTSAESKARKTAATLTVAEKTPAPTVEVALLGPVR
jgi:hypothetical protein